MLILTSLLQKTAFAFFCCYLHLHFSAADFNKNCLAFSTASDADAHELTPKENYCVRKSMINSLVADLSGDDTTNPLFEQFTTYPSGKVLC
jgi:hypothetical protein